MQPLTRIGLVRLVVFLACASVVALAQDRYGCAVSQKCPADPGFAGGRLKCQRCQSDLLHLMNDERLNAETENKPMCQSMVRDNYDGGNYNYYDVSGDDDLAKCFTPGFLLYDGAFECFAFRQGGAGGTILAALEKCIGAAVGFYGCLCNKGINDDHVRSLTPCFGRGQVPIMERICPPRQIKRFPPRFAQQLPANKGPKPQLGQNRRKGNRRSTGGPSDSSRDDSTVGTDVAPHQDSDETYSDGSDGDYFVDDWPPSLSDQFSPVLKVSISSLVKIVPSTNMPVFRRRLKADARVGYRRIILSRHMGTRRSGQHHHARGHLLRAILSLSGAVVRQGVAGSGQRQGEAGAAMLAVPIL